MKIIDIAIKDLTRSSRSLFLLGMTLAAPLLITGLMYFAFGSMKGGDVSLTAIRVGLVNADTLPTSAPLKTSLGQNIRDMFFDQSVKTWINARDYADEASARAAIDRQEIGVAVIIPPDFTLDFLAGNKENPIVLLQDPTLSLAPAVVRDMVTSLLDGVTGGGIAMQVVNARLQAFGKVFRQADIPSLTQQYAAWYVDFQRTLFHSPERAALVLVAPAINGKNESGMRSMMGLVMAGQLVFFSFFTGAYAMMSILQEDEEGTLARLFSTPTRRTTILAGKFLAVFLTVMFQGVVLVAVGRLAFGVSWGQPASIVLSLLGQMLASVGLAVLLVSFIKTSKQAGPIFGGALTGLGMLSGLFTTNINMPASFAAFGNFTPQGWVLKAWKLSLAGQPAVELLLPFSVLVVMGIVMFILGAISFKKRYA
ncbi:MAG TPA: ABC transporter permease [Anaerolineales bacterium]|jgi:ABC-2 type transport system permease protein